MDPISLVTIFNIIAPHVFGFIASLRKNNPGMTYEQALREAGVKLSAEEAQLLADMAQAVRDGAIPRP